MKTLIAISDTHGQTAPLKSLQPRIDENDFIVHLGDGFHDFRSVYYSYPKKAYALKGNCDPFQSLPREEILEIEKCRIFCCHGDAYGVKTGLDRLICRAQELSCNVVLYGHTHRADVSEYAGILLVNPGTLSGPLSGGGSYAYLVCSGEKATAVIVGDPLR